MIRTNQVAAIVSSDKKRNQYAQYALGKLYLTGQEVPQDREQALYWFTQSAAQGNRYAQYFLDRWPTMGQPSVMLSALRLLYHLSRIFRENVQPQDATTMVQHIDSKLR